jgi:hypothetical protein
MQVITDLGDLARVRLPGLRGVLTQRLNQIELRDGEALTDVGAFFVAECGDSVAVLDGPYPVPFRHSFVPLLPITKPTEFLSHA